MNAADSSEPGDSDGPDPEGFVPAVGFVLGGFAVAAGFMQWSPAVAYGPFESLPAVLAGLAMLVGFGARRYELFDRRASLLAGLGAVSLIWIATVALLYPVATDAPTTAIGGGLAVGFVLGVIGTGVAFAEYRGFDRKDFLTRSQLATGALGIGIFGLFVGFGFSAVGVSLYPGTEDILRSGIGTGAFSIGLGVVAVGFVTVTGRDLSYFDVEMPGRWDWAYVVVGVVAMYVILFGLGLLANALGIPSAQHSLLEAARDDPTLLLLFIPLSWLAIGPGEELLSRNIVQKYLYEGFSRYGAVLVATGVFTVIHLPAYLTAEPAAVFSTLVRLFAISLVLGLVYERTENVVVAALVHGTYDAIQFGLAYASLTGASI